MNDIFLSYASPDRAVAQQLADALESAGWSVWWDREIPYGKAFDQVIEAELNAARCVIVLWTRESVGSRWVKTEAAAAADRERLIPVLLDDVQMPFEFRRIQTAMLQGWTGEGDHPEFARLLDSVRQMVGAPTAPQAPAQTRTAQPSMRRSGLRWKMAAAGVLALLAAIGLGVVKFKSGPAEVPPPGAGSSAAGTGASSASASSAQQAPEQSVRAPAPQEQTQLPAPGATAPAVQVKGAYSIRIGDRIDEGVPAAGAGFIEAPGAKDVYAFAAAAGQRVYFRRLEYARGMELIEWKLTDPEGRTVFESRLGHSEPGVQTLRKAGTYLLTVGSDREPATGAYRLQLFNVPPPREFRVKIGELIREDSPAPGAGHIDSPGARNIYVFSAAAGQRVYFRRLEYAGGMELIEWKLTDPEGRTVFESRLGHSEPGVQTLRKAGTYLLTVGSDREPATGAYRLQLFNVPPPQQFSIRIGDTIRENAPGPGAGTIESPGAKDLYVFDAAPGQRVYFRKLDHERGLELIEWKLTDADATEVFSSRLGHTEPGVQVLRKGGTYRLEVGSDREPATGAYRLQLTNASGG
ncbi:MAG: toll/interleukin-1 receptor domain-containing protein [Burkholderiales bacterium]